MGGSPVEVEMFLFSCSIYGIIGFLGRLDRVEAGSLVL